jgi:hypothetical protein
MWRVGHARNGRLHHKAAVIRSPVLTIQRRGIPQVQIAAHRLKDLAEENREGPAAAEILEIAAGMGMGMAEIVIESGTRERQIEEGGERPFGLVMIDCTQVMNDNLDSQMQISR